MKKLKTFSGFLNEDIASAARGALADLLSGNVENLKKYLSAEELENLETKKTTKTEIGSSSYPGHPGQGTNFKSGGVFPKENMIALEKSMDKHGITNEFARRAILGVISKEHPGGGSEDSYFSTPIERMRQVYGDLLSKYSNEEIEGWKKLGKTEFDHKFWEAVYGKRLDLGNNNPGDGERYKGRGFNQITGKGNYENLQNIYNKSNRYLGSIDIVKNPEVVEKPEVAAEFAILYFIDSFKAQNKNPNDYSNLDSAVTDYIRANAGWGTPLNNSVVLDGLQKAKTFASSLDSTKTS